MMYVVNCVLASGVDMVLEKDFAGFALQEMEIHPLMLLIQTLSMILQTFSLTLHNPRTNHTRVNYVGTTLIMVIIVHYGSRLSMSRNRATNKTLIKDYRNERIDIRYKRECEIKIDELKGKFNGMSIEINKKKELRQQEQAANLSTYTTEPSRCFNSFYDDDDYEESIIPLNEIVYQIPPSIAITPDLLIMEPEDSLIMGDENLSTIPEKESENECDLPFCDDSSPLNVLGGNSVTFSNPLFDSNEDFTSSDDESLPEEDVPKENFKIYSNPLFQFDDEYISSDVNPLFNEVLKDIESEDSYVSKLDEPDLLVTPLSKLNEDECFDPGGDFILEEIEACLTSDFIPPRIDDDDFDPEGDILLLEKLLNDDPSAPLPLKELNF
ncbi:hypothetical protein Tco_1377833 [Tanacetum coccineum]